MKCNHERQSVGTVELPCAEEDCPAGAPGSRMVKVRVPDGPSGPVLFDAGGLPRVDYRFVEHAYERATMADRNRRWRVWKKITP